MDWGTHSAKLVGIRKVGSKIELTHCLLFDLPGYASPRQIQPIIQNRLKKINFHGGRLTVGLPATGVTEIRSESTSKWREIWQKIRAFLGMRSDAETWTEQVNTLRVDEQFIRQEWMPRASLDAGTLRLELEGHSLPLIPSGRGKTKVFLSIGHAHSYLTISQGKEVLEFKALSFSLQELSRTVAGTDTEAQQRVFSYLRSLQLTEKAGELRWRIPADQPQIPNLHENLERELKILSKEIIMVLSQVKEQKGLEIEGLCLSGGGALYSWMRIYLSWKLRMPVKPLRPLSSLIGTDGAFSSKKLRAIEPIFAEATALALSGLEPGRRKHLELSSALSWLVPREWGAVGKIRRYALIGVLLILMGYLSGYFYFDRLYQRSETVRLQLQDLSNHYQALQTLIQVDHEKKKKSGFLDEKGRYSSVLRIIGEAIPPGTWLTDLELVPVSRVKDLRIRRKRIAGGKVAFILRGKAVSGNYISEFYNRLYQSGYFSQLVLKRADDVVDISETVSFVLLARARDGS